ncbi:NTP transferase domain-containing protein [Kribbella qitaiheensis]|uniref:NTP transferase domain-containing protein n=1 Tax=Kribbella qitaiheensis TaxID=1544730 RepID=A0A7G6WY04_9ACTN|nr:NTP transferase domain-containing protein [Kribbella qitaiheensis]QNE18869.1 NTP transferase domain-containing protein [Kribbella qitaiheensis]
MEPYGVLLAAGAGTRIGMPKALVRDTDGVPSVVRSVRVLRDGGCGPIGVVVGAAAEEVTALLADAGLLVDGGLLVGGGVTIVPSLDWQSGMSASLRSGLSWVAETPAEAVVVHFVDMPDVGADVVRRVVAGRVGTGDAVLSRAGYGGRAGHPVLMGRAHWEAAKAAATGDRGAGSYLKRAGCPLIPCEDLTR